ncbi:MAG: hydroxymethylbilane synthase [Desulfobacteraceae bacterium]|nr:hydroxymethylbilane synthase [Desulfobacteraceae bacterium]
MKNETVRIGTRGSKLALWQAGWVKDRILAHHPDAEVELEVIKTSGDKILDVPLAKVGGKGLFVKEIEEALLDGRIHMAVHSMKDMPGRIPEGLCIAAVPEREMPWDVLIARQSSSLEQLPMGAKVGTSSLRRASQLLYFRPDFEILPLRGNIDTRIRKLAEENMDAVVLAAAGVKRLGYIEHITGHLDPAVMLPAVGQGSLCIETRQDDSRTGKLLEKIHHRQTACTVFAERAFLHRLEGGCQVPIAAFAKLDEDSLELDGMVAETDGSIMIRDRITGPANDPEALGTFLAERLINRGAGDIVRRLIEEGQ